MKRMAELPGRGPHAVRDAAARGAPLTVLTMVAAVLAGAVLLLAGCASPGATGPQRALADASAERADAAAFGWPHADWWAAYGDAGLTALIEQALAEQPDLQVAQARIRQAEGAAGLSAAARQPQLNASANATDQRFTANGAIPPPLAGSVQWSADAQLGLGWDADLFGRSRAALEAGIGRLRAARADAQAARVLLAARVAGSWFDLARLIAAREVAIESLRQREQVFALVRQRIAAGLDTQVERRQAEGLIAQSRVEIEALAESITRTRHALAELAGQRPQALDTLAPRLAALQPQRLPATLPADLLGRRADLVAQRWRVEAARREVDAARAEFYPDVDLVAFAGLSSIGLDRFVSAGSRSFGAGAALHLPTFDGGRLRANLGTRSAEVDAAVEGYNATLLRALREAADEVDGLQSIERQQRAQAEATAAADAAYAVALQRYEAGLGNFLTVLTAQTNVLAQRRAATDLQGRHLASEVALVRALGGGFQAGTDELPSLARAGR